VYGANGSFLAIHKNSQNELNIHEKNKTLSSFFDKIEK
jgi:hypothetical protein